MRWSWLLFLPSVAAFTVHDCVSPDWACDYMGRHNKTYASKEEFHERVDTLSETRRRLLAHGRRLSNVAVKLGPYADRDRPSNPHLRSSRRSKMTHRALRASPIAFDWRSLGFETPVHMQGDCGGCFAFAAATVLEYWDQKWRGGVPRAISAQGAMDCSSKGAGGLNEGCDGGLMEDVFEYAETHALPYESEDPYVGVDSVCRKGSVHEFVSSYGVLSIDEDPYAEDHFAWIISHFGPLAVSVDSSSDAFQNYAGGIFPADLCERNIDHAMVIVGYAPDYWIIKNSWSSEWGEDGYMRLERGSNACGIASYATYVRTVHE